MASKPFLDTSKLDSTSFYETFRKYDKDGNNYIEAKEIDAFMKDLFKMKYGSNYSKDQVTKLKDFIMQKYDKNHDKKLDITELAAILPVEENFLLTMKHPVGKARRGSKEVMSSVDFMKIWTNYDPHREGYLGRKQLRGFIADYLEFYEEPKKPADEAEKQVDYLLKNFDKDHDGEITMTELQGFLKVENNFLKSYEIGKHGFSNKDFDKLWNHYDPDHNGRIGGAELDALVRDIYLKMKKSPPDMKDISDWRDMIMRFSDRDGDDEVSKEEMGSFMTKGLSNALKRLK